MLLAIDIGNTHVVLGLYQGAKLEVSWRLQSDLQRTVDEYALEILGLISSAELDRKVITRIAICCVVPALSRVFVKLSRKYFKMAPLVISSDADTGIEMLVDDPRGVGPDRIVNAVASRELVGTPNVVVDLGTATTFDIVDRQGRYIGGLIAPGLIISTNALFDRAAMLPSIELKRPEVLIGKNTRDAMMAGIVYGYAGLVDGILERLQQQLGDDLKFVATGGLAAMISEHSRFLKQVLPELTLAGLRLIAERNPVVVTAELDDDGE